MTDTIAEFIAISVEEENDDFYFYHFNTERQILFKTRLEDADYHIINSTNFTQENDQVLFYHDKTESIIFHYDLKTKELSSYEIRYKNKWHSHSSKINFTSSDESKTVHLSSTEMTLIHHSSGLKETLIAQEYTGEWSFGDVTWHENNEKFYFDNSGVVACIWEIDLKARTIDKIVPEHEAHSPVFCRLNSYDHVVYCEQGKIKSARIERVGADSLQLGSDF